MIRSSIMFENDTAEEDVIIAVKQFIYDGIDIQENSNINSNKNSDDETKQSDNNNNNNNNNKDINNNVNDVNDNVRYMVAFKRLKGSAVSYQRVVEQFYNADDIIQIMDTEDIENLSD